MGMLALNALVCLFRVAFLFCIASRRLFFTTFSDKRWDRYELKLQATWSLRIMVVEACQAVEAALCEEREMSFCVDLGTPVCGSTRQDPGFSL